MENSRVKHLGQKDTRTLPLRPMRDLLLRLSPLPVEDGDAVDLRTFGVDFLVAIAQDAEITLSTIHHGLGAIGHLLAHSAVPIEDGTVGADSLESLGFLMAELGDLAAACMTLAARCRRAANSDHECSP